MRHVVGLIGNYSCSNRGDAAILRGVADDLAARGVDARLFSEQPAVARLMLDRECRPAPLAGVRPSPSRSALFAAAAASPKVLRAVRRRKAIAEAIEILGELSAIVFVGGSYFVDLYGPGKYYLPLLARAKAVPYVLCGHSVGPLESRHALSLARRTLPYARHVALRDGTSLPHVRRAGVPESACSVSADTAWLTAADPASQDDRIFGTDDDIPTVAVTVRRLAPFEKRLGITQPEFDRAVANCLDDLVDRGFRVIAVSMCTGLGGYHMDDRLAAHEVRRRLKHPDRMTVVMDELSDSELSAVLGRCAVLLGTRMHSTILAMNAGTPALAIPYEHKSVGLFRQLGFEDRVLDIRGLTPQAVGPRVRAIVDDRERQRARTREAAAGQRELAASAVTRCLESLGIDAGGRRASRSSGARREVRAVRYA